MTEHDVRSIAIAVIKEVLAEASRNGGLSPAHALGLAATAVAERIANDDDDSATRAPANPHPET